MRGFAFCRLATKEFWLGYSIKSLLALVRANYFPFVQNLGFLGQYRLSRPAVLLSWSDTRPAICLCPLCRYREADLSSAQLPLFELSDFEQKKRPRFGYSLFRGLTRQAYSFFSCPDYSSLFERHQKV